MKNKRLAILVSLWVAIFIGAGLCGSVVGQSGEKMMKEDVDRLMTELSNWGRWGKDDQLGALNLITPEKRKKAATLVKLGVAVSLARETNKEQAADNPSPYDHNMILTGTGNPGPWLIDSIGVTFHGYQHTHLDALCHMFYRGKMYNGFPAEEVTRQGAGKLGIQNLKQGIFTRGILIDIPKLRGIEYLEPGTPIYPSDLDAWEKKSGLRVGSGDVIFIRTGRWARRGAKGAWNPENSAAGLHASAARWIRQRDVAMLGSDAASDALPSGIEGVTHPIHQLMLVAMGVHIFDNCDLEALSRMCEEQKRWEFLLTASPVAVTGGTGSPLNPIAVF
ncbi:MAG: cyclase family protein [Acidobacteriota bacterium]|nr:MAG: cyclase family protein [Acidobacteriota bacterium]